MTQLQGLLDRAVTNDPDKIAIRTDSSRVSYGDLDLQIRKVAYGLQRHGIECGDRVAWFLPNCLEAVLTTMACYQIGAIAVPLNYRYVSEELDDVVQRIGAKVLIFHTDRKSVVKPLCSNPKLSTMEVSASNSEKPGFESLLASPPIDRPKAVERDHPALILFTSGSTGRPKGVTHSHAGAYCAISVSRRVFEFEPQDVVLVGKPISHAGGLQTQLMPTLLAGGETLLAMKPEPAKAVEWIRAHSVTEYGLLASDLLDFIEYLERNPTELPSFRNAIGSGDSVPEDLHQRFRDLLGWEVMEGAGMTEVGGYYAVNPRFGRRKWGSLGLPTPETELRIIDGEGADCSAGQIGEIALRTQSTTIGYWNDPQATAELYRDGWLHTGDLAHQDEDGYVWFVGRRKLMIIRRGSNIAPAEVESVIDRYPQIHASVVVGVTDPKEGQIPVACIALLEQTRDFSEKELRTFVAEHLAAYKNPVHYLILDELPRTGTGKFDRQQLHELAAQRCR